MDEVEVFPALRLAHMVLEDWNAQHPEECLTDVADDLVLGHWRTVRYLRRLFSRRTLLM